MPLDKHGFAWLCKVARTSGYRRARSREHPAGAFLPGAAEHDPRELAEPAGGVLDSAEQAIDRERHQQQRQQLLALDRPRAAVPCSSRTRAQLPGAEREQTSVRTVERQILRGRRKLKEGAKHEAPRLYTA